MHAATAPAGVTSAAEHLLAELEWLELLVKRQVRRLRAAQLLTDDEFRGLYIADAQVDALLQGGDGVEGDASDPALDALVDQARAAIDRRIERGGPDAAPPLARLAQRFGLSPLETGVLLVAVAPELDLRWETLYAYVQNDVTRRRPTADLALKLLCARFEERLAGRAVFSHQAPLVRHGLLRLVDDPHDRAPSLLARSLKVDERVVGFLLEHEELAVELSAFVRVPQAMRLHELALSDRLRQRLTGALAVAAQGETILLRGPPGSGRQAAAAALAAELGIPILSVDLEAALADDADAAALATALRREAVLRGAAICLARAETMLAPESAGRRHAATLLAALQALPLPLLLASTVGWDPALSGPGHGVLAVELTLPEVAERRDLWRRAIGDVAGGPDIRGVADRFVLGHGQVASAFSEARHLAALRPAGEDALTEADLLAAARSQSSRGLDGLAEKVEAVYGWSDIVLPPRPLAGLREVCASVTHRHTVHADWGFGRKLPYGTGLTALFSGPSGTGKTMAAQIVAGVLGLDLYKIDLSSVVSKYIGETERNLRRIFQAAVATNAMLFFDEADALFGKRSQVRDAHDRYANIEVAYLLQQIEDYDGIVILATNLSSNIDEAFTRRMDHIVAFPLPGPIHRERIWRWILPGQAPLARDVDLGFLARQFQLTGGSIRNIALAAAFRAAEEGDQIRMEHLIRATARELEKLGRLPSRAEFREYYALVPELAET